MCWRSSCGKLNVPHVPDCLNASPGGRCLDGGTIQMHNYMIAYCIHRNNKMHFPTKRQVGFSRKPHKFLIDRSSSATVWKVTRGRRPVTHCSFDLRRTFNNFSAVYQKYSLSINWEKHIEIRNKDSFLKWLSNCYGNIFLLFYHESM